MRWGKKQGGPNESSNCSEASPEAEELTQDIPDDDIASPANNSLLLTDAVRSLSLDTMSINTMTQNVIATMNKIDSLEKRFSDLKCSIVNTDLSRGKLESLECECSAAEGFSLKTDQLAADQNSCDNIESLQENFSEVKTSNARIDTSELRDLRSRIEVLEKYHASDLKCSVEKMQSFVGTVSQWKADIDTASAIQNGKMNALDQSVSDLRTHVTALKDDAIHYNKMQTLAWALENAHLGSFRYYNYQFDEPYVTSSKDYAKNVLMSFRMGLGQIIGPHYMIDDEGKDNEEKFREQISSQIHMLTGVRPRISREDDGSYAISYC